jgi:hypothetical protein
MDQILLARIQLWIPGQCKNKCKIAFDISAVGWSLSVGWSYHNPRVATKYQITDMIATVGIFRGQCCQNVHSPSVLDSLFSKSTLIKLFCRR